MVGGGIPLPLLGGPRLSQLRLWHLNAHQPGGELRCRPGRLARLRRRRLLRTAIILLLRRGLLLLPPRRALELMGPAVFLVTRNILLKAVVGAAVLCHSWTSYFFSRPCLSTYFIRRRRKRFSTNEHWIETQSSAKKRKNNYKRKLNKVQPDLSPKTAGKAPICLNPANNQTSASSLTRRSSSATVSC